VRYLVEVHQRPVRRSCDCVGLARSAWYDPPLDWTVRDAEIIGALGRLVEDRPIEPANESVRRRVGNLRFHSATYRLFRLDGLEPAGEDYGQAVVYRGGIDEQPDCFVLDKHHRFELGRIVPVCGNTYRMLNESRFGPHFDFFGNRDTHYGIFAGHGTAMPFHAEATPTGGGSCCG
jgi:hypothetical protein